MKCTHCSGEHPDGFKFCPVTGKEIMQSFKACTNSECIDFRKYILPPDATFCPRCGQQIGNSLTEHNQNFMGMIDKFYPIGDFRLGKTSPIDYEGIYGGCFNDVLSSHERLPFEYYALDSPNGHKCYNVLFIEYPYCK